MDTDTQQQQACMQDAARMIWDQASNFEDLRH